MIINQSQIKFGLRFFLLKIKLEITVYITKYLYQTKNNLCIYINKNVVKLIKSSTNNKY